jgi:hypothetical protein
MRNDSGCGLCTHRRACDDQLGLDVLMCPTLTHLCGIALATGLKRSIMVSERGIVPA